MAESLMRVLSYILLALLVVLGLAAGAAKIMQAPQEIIFFEAINFPLALLVPFGVLQVAAAVLTVLSKTRKIGLGLAATMFLISAIMIFMGGDIGFGLFSLVPAAIAVGLIFLGSFKNETL